MNEDTVILEVSDQELLEFPEQGDNFPEKGNSDSKGRPYCKDPLGLETSVQRNSHQDIADQHTSKSPLLTNSLSLSDYLQKLDLEPISSEEEYKSASEELPDFVPQEPIAFAETKKVLHLHIEPDSILETAPLSSVCPPTVREQVVLRKKKRSPSDWRRLAKRRLLRISCERGISPEIPSLKKERPLKDTTLSQKVVKIKLKDCKKILSKHLETVVESL